VRTHYSLSPVTIHTPATLTAKRTVILGFDHSRKAKMLKSTVKFAVEKE
jgi:hypothetical protein